MFRSLHSEQPLAARVYWTDPETSPQAIANLESAPEDNILMFAGLGETGTDGGIEGAYLREPYELVPGEQDDPEFRGIVSPLAEDEAAFDAFYLAAADARLPVMTHVTGDAGLDIALDAIDRLTEKRSIKGLAWVLHGCFLVDDRQLERIRKHDLIITAQSQPYLLGMQMVKWWGKERTDRSVPIRAFLDAGIVVGGGSDAPAGIANPLESIDWMVNRKCLGDLQLDRTWSISVEEALRIYTLGSAISQRVDDRLGTLEPGKLADLVVLAENPLKVDPLKIANISCAATIMDGRIVHDRDGIFKQEE